jgi:phosphoenolpyruvate carboxykinase (diphosphate)
MFYHGVCPSAGGRYLPRVQNGMNNSVPEEVSLAAHAQIKLALLGFDVPSVSATPEWLRLAEPLIARQRQTARLLSTYLNPADQRIQSFLFDYFQEIESPRLPTWTLVLDRKGLGRLFSLPLDADEFTSPLLKSYRLRQGVLHNPTNDRRTTQGVFHVAEGGLPIPDDKKAVPRAVFARLLAAAFQAPEDLTLLPYTANVPKPAHCWVSLLLRPLICPAVPRFISEKRMEIRFFAPASLVSNLDFVETIFGNAGDPFLPENDAALDVEGWSGHTGCVILAPHLTKITKQELGLPHWDQATERQRRDRMCWKSPEECYNDGSAFKITARDETGVIVTVIADNYFGYCKKEVKTQISFAANLFGLSEEEHAGGALVFPSFDLGEAYDGRMHVKARGHTFEEASQLCAADFEVKPEGYAVDRLYPEIVLVREDATFDLHSQRVRWSHEGQEHFLKLLPDKIYVRPSGYRVVMEKPPGKRAWRLVGTTAEPTLCHKPCTVSGGGKSEISKPIADAIIQGPVFVADFKADFAKVDELLKHDYSDRFKDLSRKGRDQRSILSPERSLGSVIKLLTPSDIDYTPEYNAWVRSISQHVKELVFVVKRFYDWSWDSDWRERFSVDIRDGLPGNELKFDGRVLVSNFLRVGFAPDDGSWRVFGLRKDFHPSFKIQTEDDITASVVVPSEKLLNLNPVDPHPSVKFVANTEARLFQRPDDAIHRGYDKQAEADLAAPGNFISNFEPLTWLHAQELVEDSIGFGQFSEPMQRLIKSAVTGGRPGYFVSSAHPRIVDGKPTKNPRYLQVRPDLTKPREVYLAGLCTRLARRMPSREELYTPVNAVVPGRRNNPPEPGVRSLAVFNPLHYLELPEAFMEFISSMTGKSPSTTGAGSEGALTKGPFNALPPIIDLNAALVSYLLTDYPVFLSAAGYVGPKYRVDHDISLLVPELWCRLMPVERDPKYLIENGYFERCCDFEHDGKRVAASRLGYRMTGAFASNYFGRIFNSPHLVFPEEMLKPELQGLDIFVDGMANILETHRRVAELYFADGSIELACPPLRALLHIMRDGQFEGKTVDAPDIRRLFTRPALLASDWYADRLKAKHEVDVRLWRRHVAYLESFLNKHNYADEAARLGIAERLQHARQHLNRVSDAGYAHSLVGTIGVQPLAPTQSPDT